MEEGFEELRSRVILVNKQFFTLYEYPKEEEIESRVSQLTDFLFGPKALYFDIRQRMASKARKIVVPDGLLLQLEEGKSKLWIVEHELSSHDLYTHIQPQISGFVRALRSLETLRDVQIALYEEIQADKTKDKVLREFLGPTSDMFFFLDRVLHERCGIIIVIDEVTPQLMEICEDFSRDAEVRVIEFRTYQKEGEEIYLFNPFKFEEVVKPPKLRKEYPEHRKSWEARLEWANASIRNLVYKIIESIESELPGISHSPKYRWYYFYKDKTPKPRSLFAVLLPEKRSLHVRIRIDPSKFEDRLNMTKQYKGWFFRARGEERGFSIKSPDQLNYALELIRQAYEHAQG